MEPLARNNATDPERVSTQLVVLDRLEALLYPEIYDYREYFVKNMDRAEFTISIHRVLDRPNDILDVYHFSICIDIYPPIKLLHQLNTLQSASLDAEFHIIGQLVFQSSS
jgi:hypothetical protein